jgi:hypothetical protein
VKRRWGCALDGECNGDVSTVTPVVSVGSEDVGWAGARLVQSTTTENYLNQKRPSGNESAVSNGNLRTYLEDYSAAPIAGIAASSGCSSIKIAS